MEMQTQNMADTIGARFFAYLHALLLGHFKVEEARRPINPRPVQLPELAAARHRKLLRRAHIGQRLEDGLGLRVHVVLSVQLGVRVLDAKARHDAVCELAGVQTAAVARGPNHGARALEVADRLVEDRVVLIQRQRLQVEVQLLLGVDQRELPALAAAIAVAGDALAIAAEHERAKALHAVVLGHLGARRDANHAAVRERLDAELHRLGRGDVDRVHAPVHLGHVEITGLGRPVLGAGQKEARVGVGLRPRANGTAWAPRGWKQMK